MAYTSIFFGEIDSAEVEAAIVAQYESLTGRTPLPSDPEFAINATIAYVRVLVLQDIDRAGKANLVQYATGANLDYLAFLIGLERIDSTASVTRIQFTLVSGHAQVVIPGGTLISSTDGKAVYSTNEDVTVIVGVNTIIVNVTCTTEGSFSNGYAIGTITTIQNPQPYLVSATNLDVTAGGADEESDVSFRERWFIGLERLSVAGPKGAYEFHARTASVTIVDAEVLGPEDGGVQPGDVEIRVLVDTGVPTQAILDAVFDACDPITVRPMCDTVLVYGALPIVYSLTIGIVAFIGADTAALPDLVKAAVQAYCTAQGNGIGRDIVEDAMKNAGMLDGTQVKRLDFGAFSDIAVDSRSFARCSSITCTITAVETP